MFALRPARLAASFLSFCSLTLVALPAGRPAVAAPRHAAPLPQTESTDYLRRLDANQLDLFVNNLGGIGFDLSTGSAGLYYPRGTFQSPLFASGLWAAGKVGGEVRVAVAEYSSEWAPGAAPGGVPENRAAPDLIVYKTKAYLGDPADILFQAGSGVGNPTPDAVAHHAWSDYVTGAAPHGAPTRLYRIPNANTPDPSDSIDVLGPDLPGDLATWCVFNDLDPSSHTSPPGSTAPLGLEVKQTVYGFYHRPGEPDGTLDQAAIIHYQIRNAGPSTLDSTYFGYWADPDIGGAGDDLTGWDAGGSFGYAYNATNADAQYGSTPPALGIAVLDSPLPDSPQRPGGISSFGRYLNGGQDPSSSTMTRWALLGLDPNGNPWIDPNTLLPTRFPFSGDPVNGTGWLDTNPADRRMLISVGPISLAPGQSVPLTLALVVGRGPMRLDSIRRLRCATQAVRAAYATGFARPFAPLPPECQGPVPALATLVESEATADAVTLAWYVADPAAGPFDLERRSADEDWRTLASLSPDGEGYVRYEDRAVTPGVPLSYRLVDRGTGVGGAQGEVTVDVPGTDPNSALAISVAFAPGHELALDLALPRAGEVRYDLVTLAGRRLAGGSLGVLPAGRQQRLVAVEGHLVSGVYFVRVRQGAAQAVARAVFVQ